MIEVLGNRVLIKPDPIETMSKGGIILNPNERQAKSETSSGKIIDYGPSAWLDPALGGEPWVNRGDRVVFAKYSGKYFTDPETDEEYIVINDDAVQVRIEKG